MQCDPAMLIKTDGYEGKLCARMRAKVAFGSSTKLTAHSPVIFQPVYDHCNFLPRMFDIHKVTKVHIISEISRH